MSLYIFCTDIDSKSQVNELRFLLDEHPDIIDWSIDLEDIDSVLKVRGTDQLTEQTVSDLISTYGFNCIEMADD